jgi:hypothetical protein
MDGLLVRQVFMVDNCVFESTVNTKIFVAIKFSISVKSKLWHPLNFSQGVSSGKQVQTNLVKYSLKLEVNYYFRVLFNN